MIKKKKLSILFITNNYKPYSGGVVSSIDTFRFQLKKCGHKVTIVTFDFTGEQEKDPNVIRISSSLKFLYRDNPMVIPLHVEQPLRAVFEEKKPDIVHLHHPFLLCVAALKIAKEQNIKIFFTYHSQYAAYAEYYAPFFKTMVGALT